MRALSLSAILYLLSLYFLPSQTPRNENIPTRAPACLYDLRYLPGKGEGSYEKRVQLVECCIAIIEDSARVAIMTDHHSIIISTQTSLRPIAHTHGVAGRPEFYIFIMIERTRETKAKRSPWSAGCHENMFILCRFGNNIAIKLRNSLMVG